MTTKTLTRVEDLAADARESYRKLVLAMANGDGPAGDEVNRTLYASGRSYDDLVSDTKLVERRRGWADAIVKETELIETQKLTDRKWKKARDAYGKRKAELDEQLKPLAEKADALGMAGVGVREELLKIRSMRSVAKLRESATVNLHELRADLDRQLADLGRRIGAPAGVRRLLRSARYSRTFHGLYECLEKQRESQLANGGFDPGNLVNDRGVKLMRDSEEVKDYLGRLAEIASATKAAEAAEVELPKVQARLKAVLARMLDPDCVELAGNDGN